MPSLSKLCVHTATTKPLALPEALNAYTAAGIAGITIWRDTLDGRSISDSANLIAASNLEVVSLCRGGFFPATTAADRQKAIDDNRLAIDQAAAIGAPMVVLVCGAVPGQPLDISRQQITDGIAACIRHAQANNVKLAIEPLHPMYADDRSAVNTMAQANTICDQLASPQVGIACDVYHVWWDPDLEEQIKITANKNRLFAFHICDWLTPTTHLLTDRGLMGEGCIDIPKIRGWVESTGFTGFNEVEIFSERWWARDQPTYLEEIKRAYLHHS